MIIFILDKQPGVKLLAHRKDVYLTLKGSGKQFSKVVYHFIATVHENPSASHPGQHFGGFIIILYLVFICMSQIYNNTEHFFIYLLTIWISSLVNSLQDVCHLFKILLELWSLPFLIDLQMLYSGCKNREILKTNKETSYISLETWYGLWVAKMALIFLFLQCTVYTSFVI